VSELHGIKLFANWPQVDDELFSSLRHASDRYELLKERPALQLLEITQLPCACRVSVSYYRSGIHEPISLYYCSTRGDSSC